MRQTCVIPVIACLAIAMLVVGCGPIGQASEARNNRIIAMLVDLSRSYLQESQNIGNSTRIGAEAIGSAEPGDRIIIAGIDGEAPCGFRMLADERLTPSSLLEAHRRVQSRNKLLKDRLLAVLQQAFKEKRGGASRRTPLISAITMMGCYLSQFPKSEPRVLILLSDMVEDSQQYNFQSLVLNVRTRDRIMAKEKSAGRLADLSSIRIFVSGASARSLDQLVTLRSFWLTYFKICGADASADRYVPALGTDALKLRLACDAPKTAE